MHLHPSELGGVSSLDTAAAPRSLWRRQRPMILTALVLAVVIFGFYQYQQFSARMTTAMLSRPRPPTPIEVAVATTQRIPTLMNGIGTLQAVHQVTVAPEVGGRIVKIFFEPGTTVKSGDPLVQLYDAPQRSDLANFEAQASLAAANLQRGKELGVRNFRSPQTIDQLQSSLDQAKAGASKAQAQISQMLIRAPFSGQLGVRQVEVGAFVTPGAPIVTLTDLSRLWVNFALPEQATAQVRAGQAARVRADAYPDKVFDAVITAVEPQISAQTRMLLVQATLDNTEHLLLPGMFANAAVVLPNERNGIVVPETAVDFTLYGESVYLLREEGGGEGGKPAFRVSRVAVKTGDRFDGKVLILSGLEEGQRVAASGQLKLNDGAAVSVLPGNSLTAPPSLTKY